MKPAYATDHFKLILKKNHLKEIRLHDLRHTCATLLHACGVSLNDIKAWLGHSNISTTADIYIELDFDSHFVPCNALTQAFLGKTIKM